MGNVIPFDGVVSGGEAMVNQASMTGEAVPVKKTAESYVYAGTVVEEGQSTESRTVLSALPFSKKNNL